MQAAKGVEKHASFDLQTINGVISLERFITTTKKNLNIQEGRPVEIGMYTESGDLVKPHTTNQLAEILEGHMQDEITVRVRTTEVRYYWPIVSILISILDVATTMLLAVNLLKKTDKTPIYLGWAVVGSIALTGFINLGSAFLVLSHGKASKEVSVWIQHCTKSVVLGCFLSLLNILNLEILWMNLSFAGLNFYCPIPDSVRAYTVKRSLYSFPFATLLPIAVSVYDLTKSTNRNIFAVASLATSVTTLVLSVIKKIVVVLLSNDETTAEPSEVVSSPRCDFDSMLCKREVTVLVVGLDGVNDLTVRRRAIAAVVCGFHDLVSNIAKKNHGYATRFKHNSVEIIFNGPLRHPDHSTAAIYTGFQIHKQWNSKRVASLTGHCSTDIKTLKVHCFAATATCHVGVVGTMASREYQVVGTVWNVLSELAELRRSFPSVFMLCNEECGTASKEPMYVRPIDRITSKTEGAYTVYQVFEPESKVLQLRNKDPSSVHMWTAVFAELQFGSVDTLIRDLCGYLEEYGGVPDDVARTLYNRLIKIVAHQKKYSRCPKEMFPLFDVGVQQPSPPLARWHHGTCGSSLVSEAPSEPVTPQNNTPPTSVGTDLLRPKKLVPNLQLAGLRATSYASSSFPSSTQL
eukprot:TRINITY_DN11329_c0_g1_i2.p1 TRINITY_DN11329_c0_g1~~TRINITY_DN11329_c0_g1_i2.p1  ORF type:complete len:633 (+),score=97.88 TRINITY_DN11329_c0_g1_i2:293-2191(+)